MVTPWRAFRHYMAAWYYHSQNWFLFYLWVVRCSSQMWFVTLNEDDGLLRFCLYVKYLKTILPLNILQNYKKKNCAYQVHTKAKCNLRDWQLQKTLKLILKKKNVTQYCKIESRFVFVRRKKAEPVAFFSESELSQVCAQLYFKLTVVQLKIGLISCLGICLMNLMTYGKELLDGFLLCCHDSL